MGQHMRLHTDRKGFACFSRLLHCCSFLVLFGLPEVPIRPLKRSSYKRLRFRECKAARDTSIQDGCKIPCSLSAHMHLKARKSEQSLV